MPNINDPLSRREIAILRLLAQGLSVKMAAKRLNVTTRTIHFHCMNIRAKLDAHSMLAVLYIAGRDALLGEYIHGNDLELEECS